MPILTKVITLLLSFLKHDRTCFLKKGKGRDADLLKCKVLLLSVNLRKRGYKYE